MPLVFEDPVAPVDSDFNVSRCEQLEFDFEFNCPFIEAEYYREGAQDIIQKILPADLLTPSPYHAASQKARFSDLIPQVRWSELQRAPCSLSVLMLCKYRQNACNFFYDMISRWLLPSQKVNVELFFASDVRLPHLSDEKLSVSEIVIYLKSLQEVEEVRRNLYAIETEIRLGVVSNYHARRILEFKGLSSDGKTAMIQEKISSLIQSHSKDFDRGIFSQMQHFLVTCREDFKKSRDYHHISRIISNIHSLQKVLAQQAAALPGKRHVMVKFLKTRLEAPNGKEKPVLGILVGLNFLREHELFDSNHLMNAIHKLYSNFRAVEGSMIVEREKEISLQLIYLEVEKDHGADFGFDEVQHLRSSLPTLLAENIEQLTHPIFMPRNEEEVIRNIMALSRQIRYVNDRAQVIISFDEQKGDGLGFTVIFLRVRGESDRPIQEIFGSEKAKLPFAVERIRRLGSVRRKYLKEAAILRTSISMKEFLRPDRSVDLYRARQSVLAEVVHLAGEVRDFNGGMILKQQEVLGELKLALGKVADQHALLLEQFFYALSPMEMRSALDIDSLKQFFSMLLQTMKVDLKSKRKAGDWLCKQDARRLFAVFPDLAEKSAIALQERIQTLSLPSHSLVSFSLVFQEIPYFGYLLFSEDRDLQGKVFEALEKPLLE